MNTSPIRAVLTCAAAALLLAFGMLLTGCEDDSGGTANLDIVPASVSFPAGTATNILLTALGGSPPYTWSVNDGALGGVVDAGDTAIYTSTTAAGQNFVTVTDTDSNSVSATINQM
jgi:hypothetical protein